MITRKRWTPEDDKFLLDTYSDVSNMGLTDEEIFDTMSISTLTDRTKAAIQKRYYDLTNAGKERKYIRKDEQYSSFLDSIQTLKTSYDAMVIENKQLKKRVSELEQKEDDFDALTQIMDRARKLAFLGDEPRENTFKMDRNGNLERVK